MGRHDEVSETEIVFNFFRSTPRTPPREAVPDWAWRMEQRIMSELDDLAAVVSAIGNAATAIEGTVATLESEVAQSHQDALDRSRIAELTQALRDNLTGLQASVNSAPAVIPATPDQPAPVEQAPTEQVPSEPVPAPAPDPIPQPAPVDPQPAPADPTPVVEQPTDPSVPSDPTPVDPASVQDVPVTATDGSQPSA